MPSYSIVEYFADHSGYKCGYCKNPTSAFSQGMWAHSLNAEDYQQLIDRGWRRSGQYCYKPTMQKTCCPQYAIRCHANTFKFSKSKKKVAKRMRQFLMSRDTIDIENWKKRCRDRHSSSRSSASTLDELPSEESIPCKDFDDNTIVQMDSTTINAIIKRDVEPMPSVSKILPAKTDVEKLSTDKETTVPATSSSRKECRKGEGADPSKPLCRKAKEIRKERKLRKLQEKGVPSAEVDLISPTKAPEVRPLESSLPHLAHPVDAVQKLEITLVRVGTSDFDRTRKESLRLYQKYQCWIHGDTLQECDEKQWKRFLVDSPLNFDSSGPGQGFGTFHNQYWLDEKLIAVGVVDILPNCVSSVYLYYDPDYGFLSLGVYSALSEIALVKQLQTELSSMKYYYLGFYIHSCPKMRYKGAYNPSDLLCPETYVWVPVPKCLPTLDEKAYARLNVLNGGSPTQIDEAGRISNLKDVLCLFRRHIVTYGAYKQMKYFGRAPPGPQEEGNSSDSENAEEEDQKVREYVSFVGKICATNMLLYRPSNDF